MDNKTNQHELEMRMDLLQGQSLVRSRSKIPISSKPAVRNFVPIYIVPDILGLIKCKEAEIRKRFLMNKCRVRVRNVVIATLMTAVNGVRTVVAVNSRLALGRSGGLENSKPLSLK
ncbi:hypothetical protein EVAR_33702_1 [Eumeta japonica]|uniref:Uncharacterized protein n=1 Tax=Eumeta variegata TaxID=151549 RepID=A0A4C1VSQ0_EUMVA|nr:hypothetical protein EVAR_33702_1 [Eumeta japonica]